jgi:hypothetical protein
MGGPWLGAVPQTQIAWGPDAMHVQLTHVWSKQTMY